jgi:ribosomal protein L11
MNVFTLEAAVNVIKGTAVSMGVEIKK